MTEDPETVQFMSQMTAVEYKLPETSALARRISEAIAEGRVIGHRCPECGKVYVPPRGYCPLCSVPTGEADLVDIEPRGTITTFSVITPLQYQGQEEKDDYVQATILLDGSHSTLGMQRVDGPIADVHTGLRVEAIWRDASERKLAGGSGGRNLALGEAISGWKPTGEPDAPLEQYADYIV
ncbi:MAG: Zn-ribbon domain-containing OB-fold protein [Acidimicrobiia bacterium]